MAGFKPYKVDLISELGLEIPKSRRREANEAAAEYLKEAMLEYIGEAKSPVAGGKWTRSLTPGYKAKKGELSSSDFANLELTGEMLDSLSVDANSKSITVDVAQDQYGKAEGHNTGLYGKSSRIRPRQFMPQGNETFKKSIMQGLKEILSEFEDGEE